MAFPIGLNDRYDDLRFRNSNGASAADDSPSSSASFAFYSPPIQTSTDRYSSSQFSTLSDARASLQRRFTTNNVPSAQPFSTIGQGSRQEAPVPDLSFSVLQTPASANFEHQLNHKVQLLEKKKAEYDYLRKKKLQFQREMDLMDMQAKRDEAELHRLHREVGNRHDSIGNQSEPTTPPEPQDPGFPTALSKPNRFSASTLTSPPGLNNRASRTSSQITSPPNERARALEALTGLPSSSSQASRRNSDEEDDSYDDEVLNFNHRSAASLNRNSMPVTRRDLGSRGGLPGMASNIGPVNTSSFLLEDDDDDLPANDDRSTRRSTAEYLHMQENDDQFPVLVRRDKEGNIQRVNSASNALELTLSPTHEEPESNGWNVSRQSSRASMPLGSSHDLFSSTGESPPKSMNRHSSGQSTPVKTPNMNRHSMGAKIGPFVEGNKRAGMIMSPTKTTPADAPPVPKLNASFSTSSVPTVKSIGMSNNVPQQGNANMSAEQRLHNHNASLGRIPASAVTSNRQSRDFSTADVRIQEEQPKPTPLSPESPLQINPVYGLHSTGMADPGYNYLLQSTTPPNPVVAHAYLGTYPLYALNQAMAGMNVSSPPNQWNMGNAQWNSQLPVHQAQQQMMGGFTTNFQPRTNDSQARVIQQRRNQGSDDGSRFTNISLENLQGEIYNLCKDQHGCRYLQKKLEERKPENIQMIFNETKEYIVELMTDPFGNYLCQKLLEFTDTAQRTILINNAAPHMVSIALNQHGTRALQKMIEYVSTPEQIAVVTLALKDQVVKMIQDLNGNHVIQKCLNHLKGGDAQFIFDSVATHCVTVGSHRHGTCVIQRCVDHAHGAQKRQLIAAITSCALPLAEDPFGNYVIQYIFDQNEDAYSHPLSRAFVGHVVALSKQKFSSNVIEKCLRVADDEARHLMVQELLVSNDFERVVDDIYSNYVVQTAWDYATRDDAIALAEKIRPMLPRIRQKPYGRRFQTRIAEHDRRLGNSNSGSLTPVDVSSPESAHAASVYQTPNHRPNMSQDSGHFSSPMSSLSGLGSPPQVTASAFPNPVLQNLLQQQALQQQAAGMANFGPFQNHNPNAPHYTGYQRPPGHGFY